MNNEKKDYDNAGLPAPDLEQATGGEPVGADENSPHDPRVYIKITSHRNRNHDVDGISIKACLDALVERKIFSDDSAKEIKKITYQSVVQRDTPEETIIEISWDD